LDKIKRIVKVVGFVNAPDTFEEQPEVLNGCSKLLGAVFGERGVHARSAVGTNSLPRNVPVEIELIAEVED
jgi:enamine deaminase RidA (YjgF/YER057c/UK114 family)